MPFDPVNQALLIPQNTDNLAPSDPLDDGSTEHEYTVRTTITVTPKVGDPVSDDVDTTITVKNPCLNQDLINIVMQPVQTLEYTVASGLKTYTPPHAEFTIEDKDGNAVTHSLCGPIVYEAFYDGRSLDTDAGYLANPPPFSYKKSTREFIVETDDETLRNKAFPYKIVGTFEDYSPTDFPHITKNEAGDFVEYDNPCLAPFAFSKVEPEFATQTDTYSGTLSQWQIAPFTIEPDFCHVDYTCVDVTRDDGVSEKLTCADF